MPADLDTRILFEAQRGHSILELISALKGITHVNKARVRSPTHNSNNPISKLLDIAKSAGKMTTIEHNQQTTWKYVSCMTVR